MTSPPPAAIADRVIVACSLPVRVLVTTSMGMFVASILLCCFASVIEGGQVAPPDPEPFPCPKGKTCPIPWPVCPNPGPRCGIALPRCKPGYVCRLGRCCRQVVAPPSCPKGSLTGPLCNIFEPCKYGYTCKRGRCCSNQCPKGMLQGPFCDRNRPCKSGYKCMKGVCCRRKIIIDPPPKCPFGQIQISAKCDKFRRCPLGANCYKGICCQRKIFHGGFCPGGAPPPICELSKRPFPVGCTSDKQCPKGKKCCPVYCEGRKCLTALPFPPP